VLLADADQVSPPVQVHQLLGSWQLGHVFGLVAFLLQVAAAAWYVAAVVRLRRRGRSWSAWRTTAFLAGVAALDIAVVSGLASYDDQVFVVHVVQHLVLMMVAPPLLALGAPITLAIQAARRPLQGRIVRFLHNRLVLVLTLPLVAAALYYGSMYVVFLTSFYPFSLRHPLVHDLSHVVMFALGCLFWWPMIAVDQLPNRPAFQVRIIAMFVGMPIEVFLGVVVMNFGHPIAPQHTLSDTQAGGALFWGASMLITFAAALVMLAQWMTHEERRATRHDRVVSAGEMRRREIWEAARAAKMGTRGAAVDRATPAPTVHKETSQ
jgi:putative copper resistance protein D